MEPEVDGAACICRKIADGVLMGYACQCPVAKRKARMTNEQNIFRGMNISEAEMDAHQRRKRVDAVLAACASEGERNIVAHLSLTHRDFAADGFARRHAGSMVAALAAVPATALIASARSIARRAAECDDVSEGCRKLRAVISLVASAVAKARGANLMIASARGVGGRHAIEEGRKLAGEEYRPDEQDVDALLREAIGLLEECEGEAGEPANFKKLCIAGALLEMLLDEIVPGITWLHPDLIQGGPVDENYAMPPIEKMAAKDNSLSDRYDQGDLKSAERMLDQVEREICRGMDITPAAYLAEKAKRAKKAQRVGQ